MNEENNINNSDNVVNVNDKKNTKLILFGKIALITIIVFALIGVIGWPIMQKAIVSKTCVRDFGEGYKAVKTSELSEEECERYHFNCHSSVNWYCIKED